MNKELKVGDTVSFALDGAEVEAVLCRFNKRSFTLETLDGRRWRVGPSLVTKLADGSPARAKRTLVSVRVCPVCEAEIVCTERKDWESFSHAEYSAHVHSTHPERCGGIGIPYACGYLAYRYGDGSMVALAR
jgi:hypothetical protein